MNGKKQKVYFWRGVIFKKALLVFLFLSFVPLAISTFLTVSSYQAVMEDLQSRGILAGEEADQLKRDVFMQIFLVLCLSVVFIIFAIILFDRNITRPLFSLAGGAKEVAGGNLDVKFNMKSEDELGILASAFNEMILRLKEQREREVLAAKLKTEFMSIAAHQLRTPLSSIKWIIKMILDGDMGRVNLQQRDFVEKAYGANERMITLVNDLLNVTRIEEGRFGFEFSSVDFNKLMEDIVPVFKQQSRIRNVNFVFYPYKDPLVLIIDPQRIKIAITNLLDNALYYTPVGGLVELSVKKKGDFIEVSVKDTGVGIPENQKTRVFSKFFRGDNVVRMQTEGTGLGLYLTKNIIEKHGGKIWFESEEGKGSIFYFTIPDKKDNLDFPSDEHV